MGRVNDFIIGLIEGAHPGGISEDLFYALSAATNGTSWEFLPDEFFDIACDFMPEEEAAAGANRAGAILRAEGIAASRGIDRMRR